MSYFTEGHEETLCVYIMNYLYDFTSGLSVILIY